MFDFSTLVVPPRCSIPKRDELAAFLSKDIPDAESYTQGRHQWNIAPSRVLAKIDEETALRVEDREASSIFDAAAKQGGAPRRPLFDWCGKFLPRLNPGTNMGHFHVYARKMESTQTFLTEVFRGVHDPVVCLTDEQTSGRGRGSNTWSSPDGCLTFSFTSRFSDGKTLPFVQYLVSLAAVRAAKQATGVPELDVRIKWPNDLYGNGMKLGGVLCTSTFANGSFQVTTGLGINVSNREPTTCLLELMDKAQGANASETTAPCCREEFLAKFCNEFEIMRVTFEKHGFNPFLEEYLQTWMHTGQIVTVAPDTNTQGSTAPQSDARTNVKISGLSPTGQLQQSTKAWLKCIVFNP
jgi:biotin-[acetyl-CoA-carboxylase] ligase BirA-like protein